MKRFIVFGGCCYYPSGGFNDCVGSFDSLQHAQTFAQRMRVPYPGCKPDPCFEWWHVFDSCEMQIVAQSEHQPWTEEVEMYVA